MSDPLVSVIIPTTARRPALNRALESVLSQSAACLPIVVVNGAQADPELLTALRSRTDLKLIVTPHPGAADARALGRASVTTPFFALLDDDDEFLPGSISAALGEFADDIDAVCGNGIVCGPEGERPYVEQFPSSQDAERALLERTWISPGSMLHRTDSAPLELLTGLPFHCHITPMGLRMARRLRIKFVDIPLFRRHLDAGDQASTSLRFSEQQPIALRLCIAESESADIRRILRRKLSAAEHMLANVYLQHGKRAQALRAHLRSLRAGGFRYLPFAWRILGALSSPAP